MKRVVILALAVCACGFLAGCDDSDTGTASYDPQIDGLTPPTVSTPDLSIMLDQKKLYDMNAPAPAAAPVAPKAATPASAPASAPASTPAPAAQ